MNTRVFLLILRAYISFFVVGLGRGSSVLEDLLGETASRFLPKRQEVQINKHTMA